MTARARIAAVGAGRMGRGLAHVFAYAGHRFDLIDLKERDADGRQTLAGAVDADVRRSLGAMVDHGALEAGALDPVLDRINLVEAERADQALATADVIFEAVPEVMTAKRDALARIGRAASSAAIVASATSTIMVDDLAPMIAGADRFLNAHWLNPAFLVPLVEISPGKDTARDTVERLSALLTSVGKVPVECAASPGFIVPRLQALIMNEAARMIEDGVATAEQIDQATRFGLGFRFATMGVVEFIDWGGGDILHYASAYLADALGSDRFAAPEIVARNMKNGAIGLKTGRGFHDYEGRDIDAYQRETMGRFLELLQHYDLLKPPVR
ncbi:MAG: 3-hydroxybutyryl-CoA dehydrogenase [Alphaproteobacteria bacterium]